MGLMRKRDSEFPTIRTLFSSKEGHAYNEVHRDLIRCTTRKVLPEWFFSQDADHRERLDCLREMLPVFTWSDFGKAPFDLSFYLLCKSRPDAFKFFFEMLSRWLIPGSRMNVLLCTGSDFSLPELGSDVYSVVEIMLRIEEEADATRVRRNLPTFESEIRLGVDSAYHARRILEIKGLASDEKTALIQEGIADLIRRRPSEFHDDIFAEMQHFMVVCGDRFKSMREYRHISRIISSNYLFRQELNAKLQVEPDRRHVVNRVMPVQLLSKQGKRPVLAVMVGVTFLRTNEVLERQHLMRAISECIPDVVAVEGSFLVQRARTDQVGLLYIEVEMRVPRAFSLEEIRRLKRNLGTRLKSCVEHQMHPVFMPRNEEEIMRSMLTLSHQLRYVRDLPQVMVIFDEQTDTQLSFTVILLRVLREGASSIEELFALTGPPLEYHHDTVKIIGLLRKKYPKEATVFQLRINKEEFLRNDHSIDLRRARQAVVAGLMEVVGEVRDYNGGMLSKQDEQLALLKNRLGSLAQQNQLWLENFFHSLTPAVMRTVLECELLEVLFRLFLEAVERPWSQNVGCQLLVRQKEGYVAVMVAAADCSQREALCHAVESLAISSLQQVSVEMEVQDTAYIGMLLRSDDFEMQESFLSAIRGVLAERSSEKESLTQSVS